MRRVSLARARAPSGDPEGDGSVDEQAVDRAADRDPSSGFAVCGSELRSKRNDVIGPSLS